MSNGDATTAQATCTLCIGNPNGCIYCGRTADQSTPTAPADDIAAWHAQLVRVAAAVNAAPRPAPYDVRRGRWTR